MEELGSEAGVEYGGLMNSLKYEDLEEKMMEIWGHVRVRWRYMEVRRMVSRYF